jgi:L-threonylcarbamoyladenylate synthase
MRVDASAPAPAAVVEALAALRAGALVAFPTDTVYALAADPFRPHALDRIFQAKGRKPAKVVSLLVADGAMARRVVAEIPPPARAVMERFWPGAITLILPPRPGLPQALVPPGGGIGLRAPAGALPRAILEGLGGPVVGTSANVAGGPEPRDAVTVLRGVGGHLALLLDGGPTPLGMPSTVLDCTMHPARILRMGAVPLAAIQSILPEVEPPAPVA